MDLTTYRNKLIGSEDERAVSPVIGVILMVAITVILAAVIAAFVLDIGDLDDSAPNAQFNWESTGDDTAEVTLTSGDNINTGDITVNGGDYDNDNGDLNLRDSDTTWSAGQTANITNADGEITIVWEGDGSSTIITDYDNN